MSLLSNFQYSFQNDNVFRKKTFFIIGASVFVIILVIGFIWINFRGSPLINNTNQQQQSNQTSSQQASENRTIVTSKNFEDTSSFIRVDNEPIGYFNELLVENDKLSYITSRFLFRSNQVTNKSTKQYSPAQLISSPDGIILNEAFTSSLFKNDGTLINIPQNNFQLYPVIQDIRRPQSVVYYSIEADESGLKINQSSKIDLSDKKLVSPIKTEKNTSYQLFEIRKLGSKIYLFAFEDTNKTGNIDVYSIDNGKITLQKELTKIESFQYGPDTIIYTETLPKSTNFTNYRTSVLDFTNQKLESTAIDVAAKLAQDEVFGNIIAQRCRFFNNNLYCLIKKNRAPSDVFQEPDVIAKIDTTTFNISYILQNSVFSASSIFVINEQTVYFVGQENNFIYKINNIDKA